MGDIKRDIVKEIDLLIRSELKYYESKSLEDIINKNENKLSILYPNDIVFSISYNKKEFMLDILTRYFKRDYVDLYYERKGIEDERKITYYKDGKRNKEIIIKNAYITPDKYIIPIEETHEYVDVSSFEDVSLEIEKKLHKYNTQPFNVYAYIIYFPLGRFKLSGLT